MSYLETSGKPTKIEYLKEENSKVQTFAGPTLAKYNALLGDDVSILEVLEFNSIHNISIDDGFFIHEQTSWKIGYVRSDDAFDALAIVEQYADEFIPAIHEENYDALPILESYEDDFIPAWRRGTFSNLTLSEDFDFRIALSVNQDVFEAIPLSEFFEFEFRAAGRRNQTEALSIQEDFDWHQATERKDVQYSVVNLTEEFDSAIILALRRITEDNLPILETFSSYLAQDIPFNRIDVTPLSEVFSFDLQEAKRVYPGDTLPIQEIYSGRKTVRLSDSTVDNLPIIDTFNYSIVTATRPEPVISVLALNETFSWFEPNLISAPDIVDAVQMSETYSDLYENNSVVYPPRQLIAIRDDSACTIILSWLHPVDGQADSYEIQSQGPSLSYSHLATISGNNTGYTYLAVPTDGTWRFRVRSIKNGNTSDWSNEGITSIFCSFNRELI